jgi:hypothetical protein
MVTPMISRNIEMKRFLSVGGVALASTALMLPVTASAGSAETFERVTVPTTIGQSIRSDHTDLSAVELSRMLPVDVRQQSGEARFVVPNQFPEPEDLERHEDRADPLAAAGVNQFESPTPGVSFAGPESDDNQDLFGFLIEPPDTSGDVGLEHVVMYINLVWEVFDKEGNSLAGPLPGNTFWAGFGGPCENQNNGDPIVLYDHVAARWVFTQFAPTDGIQCFAISDGEDPLSGYTRYAFQIQPDAFPDYPKVGMWATEDGSQSVYTYTGRNFVPQLVPLVGRDVTATLFDRDAMLAGSPIVGFTSAVMPGGFSEWDGPQPGHHDKSVAPAGACPLFSVADAPTTYRFFEFCENFPEAGTFTTLRSVTVPFFSPLILSIDLPAGDVVDALPFYTMYAASHQNVAESDGGHLLAMTHTVDAEGLEGARAGMRWTILDVNDYDNISIVDTGTQAPDDDLDRWMGAVSLDQSGNLGLGYTRGGPSEFPSVYYTGRETDDPQGTTQLERECVRGTGLQLGGGGRWGDYSATRLDPADRCTFWTFQEYVETTGIYQWNTRACSFSFPSCGQAAESNTFTLHAANPGKAGMANSWMTTNSSHEEGVRFFRGKAYGKTEVVTGDCVTTLDLGNAKPIDIVDSDANGIAYLTRKISPMKEGTTLRLQAVDIASCRKSNVEYTTFD